MKRLLLTCAAIVLLPMTTTAAPIDIIGGPDANAQTMHHCGFLPASPGIYTSSPITISIIEHKLIKLGFLQTSGNGAYSRPIEKQCAPFKLSMGWWPTGWSAR